MLTTTTREEDHPSTVLRLFGWFRHFGGIQVEDQYI